MRLSEDFRAALAVTAAAAGVGFASGRELVLFFTQLGWAGWVGIPFAALIYGLLLGAICRAAARSGSASLAELYRRQLGGPAGSTAGALHALLMALTAAVMLAGAAEAGALARPVRHGGLCGAALALLIALLLNMNKLRTLPGLGLLTVALGVAFYAGMAADPRPVRVWLRGTTELALEGRLDAAVLLASLYAALNACIAGGVAVRFAGRRLHPARFTAYSGGMLCALLLCANAAIVRGGRQLLAQAMPSVLLAARWGTAGFWLCVGFGFLCAATTLTAVLGALADQLREGGRPRRTALFMLALAAALCMALGLSEALGRGYALVGWVCAFAMAALAGRMDRVNRR